MLISCPECKEMISDKALSCPRCGYPIVKKEKSTRKKRMKLPNGFGRITKLSNRRLNKPYRAMVTVGTDMNGKPIGRLLKPQAYFSTYNEAYQALVEYNKNPYDLETDITVESLYKKWSESYFKGLKPPSIRTIEAAWRYCSLLYHEKVKNIRVRHIKYLLENATYEGKPASIHIKERMKSIFNLMYDYALEYELVTHNYARDFELVGDLAKISDNQIAAHIPFTDEEMEKLWANAENIMFVDVILIQCYSGWRPQELGLIELTNVNLENWTFTGGVKTSAGRNRVVPIHTRIRKFVKKWYDESMKIGSPYLFHAVSEFSHKDDIRLTYDKYRHRFKNIMETLGLNPQHRAHDPRKHFITRAKKAKVDEYVIKILVGHSISDITEAVYTDRDLEWIRSEIEKIP